MRGGGGEGAERAVREAGRLSAEDALKQKVIDLVVPDVPQLLEKLEGRKVVAAGAERTLATARAPIVAWEPDWRTRFLSVITDPTIAYILILLGIYAILFEFSNPGLVLPGVTGPIALISGFAVASAGFILAIATVLLKSRRRPVVSGREELIGASGEVVDGFEQEGWARVHSELWRVRSPARLEAGQRVKVAGMDG